MQFALINNQRFAAAPQLKGTCPGCSQPVIAKCGTRRIWHWAHQREAACDSWWEPETEWHRAWKNNFPREWQEFIQHDTQSGEKHIADVRTASGTVIEFQYSHLDPQERTARERFYQNMVWVADGTRLKRDYLRFFKSKYHFAQIMNGVFLVTHPEKLFPPSWSDSSVPVLLDFRGTARNDPQDATRELLWCVLPGRIEGKAVVITLNRGEFVTQASSNSRLVQDLLQGHAIANNAIQLHRQQRANAEAIRASQRYYSPRRGRRRF